MIFNNQAKGWPVKTVEELIDEGILEKPLDGNHGNSHPKADDYVESGVPFIMASDLEFGMIKFSSCKFISPELAQTLRKGFAKIGDVLLSHKATIGRTAIIQQNDYPYLMLTPQVTYYRVKDRKKLSNWYLKYYFDSIEFQNLLNNWAGGGSTRAYLGITGQRKLPILIPPIEDQKKIETLGFTIDRKIYLNQQISKKLEEIAHATFKSWFINYEPVYAKKLVLEAGMPPESAERAAMAIISGSSNIQEIADDFKTANEKLEKKLSRLTEFEKKDLQTFASLFPASFEESAFGEIPRGWTYKPIKEVCRVINGRAYKNTEFKEIKSNYTFRLQDSLMSELRSRCKKEGISTGKVIEKLIRVFLEN